MIRAAGYQVAASVHTLAMHALSAALAEPLAFTPDITTDGIKAAQLLARVEAGALDICYFASSYLAARVPALDAIDRPFAWPNRTKAFADLDGALGARLAHAIEAATGFTLLGVWDNGFRHLSNARHPIAHPSDCRGLRLRILDNAQHRAMFERFGFLPEVIDVRDLAEAVATGRVDAQENPLTNTVNFGLHTTHRFHSLTGHLFGVALLLANRAWFEALPPDRQIQIRTACAVATTGQRRLAAAEDDRCLTILKGSGAEVLESSQINIEEFKAILSK